MTIKTRLINYLIYPFLRIFWFLTKPKTKGVKILIQYKNQILLVKNTYGHKMWSFPGGGVKKHESPKQAALREISEEVSIDLKKIKPVGRFLNSGEFKKDTVWVYKATIRNPTFKVDPTEISEAQWFDLKDIPKIDILQGYVSQNVIKMALKK